CFIVGGLMVRPEWVGRFWKWVRREGPVRAAEDLRGKAAAHATTRLHGRGSTAPGPATVPAPLLTRMVAVAYVLSPVIGPVGFVLLTGTGGYLWSRRGFDERVLALIAGGLACLLLCRGLQWWVRRRAGSDKVTSP